MARPKRKPFYAQIVSKEILENNSWIVEYNNNSRVVIEYLVSSEAKKTAYYASLNCLEKLKDYLVSTKKTYSYSEALEWYDSLNSKDNYLITIQRLNEVYETGSIKHYFIELAIEFTKQIKSAGYSVSVVKEARYTIHSLLVFLNINHYPYNPEIADIWLDIHKTSIRKTECKSLKRILFLFDSFLGQYRTVAKE